MLFMLLFLPLIDGLALQGRLYQPKELIHQASKSSMKETNMGDTQRIKYIARTLVGMDQSMKYDGQNTQSEPSLRSHEKEGNRVRDSGAYHSKRRNLPEFNGSSISAEIDSVKSVKSTVENSEIKGSSDSEDQLSRDHSKTVFSINEERETYSRIYEFALECVEKTLGKGLTQEDVSKLYEIVKFVSNYRGKFLNENEEGSNFDFEFLNLNMSDQYKRKSVKRVLV